MGCSQVVFVHTFATIFASLVQKGANTNEQWKKHWLFRVCKGWDPTQLYRDYFISHDIRIPINQPGCQWKVGPGFFRGSRGTKKTRPGNIASSFANTAILWLVAGVHSLTSSRGDLLPMASCVNQEADDNCLAWEYRWSSWEFEISFSQGTFWRWFSFSKSGIC